MTRFEREAVRARIAEVTNDAVPGFDLERHRREIAEVVIAAKRPRDLYLDLHVGRARGQTSTEGALV